MNTADHDGDRAWTYVADHRRKPHVHPLATPAGHVLTTVEPDDHPWQRGLWFAVKYVDDDNFWEELAPYGVLRHVEQTIVHWVRPDRETVAIVEDRHLAHVTLDALGDRAYAIDWTTTLVPATDTVLDRTEYTTWGGYGGLALRGRSDWSDTRITLDDGSRHERVVDVAGRWLDITGSVDGVTAGVTILDHPGNLRHPVPWYASTRAGPGYGDGWANFVNAAFLFRAPLSLEAGVPLSLRYRIVIHDGDVDTRTIDRWWTAWTVSPATGRLWG